MDVLILVAFLIGIVLGMWIQAACIRSELVRRYRRAKYESAQMKDGDPRKQFWRGIMSVCTTLWFHLVSNFKDTDRVWKKKVGE